MGPTFNFLKDLMNMRKSVTRDRLSDMDKINITERI